MNKLFILSTLLISLTTLGQNKKIIYGFDKIPQVLILNPGTETSYKCHIGIPLLSSVSSQVNISGITPADIFEDDSKGIFEGKDFNTKFRLAVDKLSPDDYLHINSQFDILNLGYKVNDRNYISGGLYIETDIFSTLSKDFANFISIGNPTGTKLDFMQISSQCETVGVYHFGISRKLNHQLTIGTRFKIYSGAASMESVRNTGTLTTVEGSGATYTHIFKNIDFSLKTSGIKDENNDGYIPAKELVKKSFFGGNFGVGLDIGYTFHFSKQLEFSASLLDFGFIKYKKDISSKIMKGNYTFSGVELDFKKQDADLWNNLKLDVKKNLNIQKKNKEAYTLTRPLKIYTALAYSFGKSKNRANCHDNTYRDFYDNTLGGQVFCVSQPNGLNFAYTAFYQRKASKHINLKATYTIDDFSYTNIGLGLSLNLWKLNIYATAGNIIKLFDAENAHTATLQGGINFIIN